MLLRTKLHKSRVQRARRTGLPRGHRSRRSVRDQRDQRVALPGPLQLQPLVEAGIEPVQIREQRLLRIGEIGGVDWWRAV